MTLFSTHVLDIALGRPAVDVGVVLERKTGTDWVPAGSARTDRDGRVRSLLDGSGRPGTYRLVFDTGAYLAAQGTRAFFPQVTIEFDVLDAGAHCHVPLLLSPFGYSTYRGS